MRLLLLALTFALATPLAAQEMTDAEREAFRAEVRAYLLENPEVLMEAIGILEQREQEAQVQADVALAQANADALFNDPTSFVGGNPDGDITIVEFMDYRCGFCKRAYPEVSELVSGDGNIRYIIKEFPILGEESILASRFAIATRMVAGDEAYDDVHSTLMEFEGNISEASLQRIGEAFGLDTDAVFAEMESNEVTTIINNNRALAQRMRISGTPTFVVEDQMLRGYVPLDQMQQIVAAVRG
ncbi:Protein-disulfide isomerase [Cognatiyoonia koreensis]|uniref:Protein-disulfide isomerase n=1 Tax=Cognatiyoonia koreensis TaxID=364200 RepID=A0A1I0PP48_9RHOB|nr:DsbA family protein [Cognatiyoonia koreensis]SEW16149.1 Protein-disulfide isomerase [Cognatiyoonia koreensis]